MKFGFTFVRNESNPRPQYLVCGDILANESKVTNKLKRHFSTKHSKTLRSSDSVLPRIYGLPKIHKPNVPLCRMVSFIGTATYQLAKFLKQILVPLVGNTLYTAKNSSEFVELISSIKLGKSESQVLFDVVSLFTLVPPETTKTIVANRVGDDCTLGERTRTNISVYNHRFCVQ